MGKEQLSELEKHGWYFSVPRGVSMYPMIRNGKDIVEIRKLTEEPKRYDLVMYTRGPNEQGVIHRVLRKRKKDGVFVICGDNCWQLEYIRPERIYGIATRFCRKGTWHTVDEKPYLLYVHLWCDFYPVRAAILWCKWMVLCVLRKIRKTFFRKKTE